MLLSELFDSHLNYKMTTHKSYVVRYEFKSGNDELTVAFGSDGEFHFDRLEDGDMMPTSDLTNSGDSNKVFSTVLAIIKDYVKLKQPKVLKTNCVPERVSLYTKMLKKIGTQLGYKLTVSSGHFKLTADET